MPYLGGALIFPCKRAVFTGVVKKRVVNNDKWFRTWEDFLEIFHEQFNALMDDESGSFDRNFFLLLS